MFHSPALNSLVRKSLVANPTLQSQLAALRAAKEIVYAQQGKYFPFVAGNYDPTRQETASAILQCSPAAKTRSISTPPR